jgi:hypothetical protein
MRALIATALFLSALGVPAAGTAQFHMEDSLLGSTSGNPIGGSFGSEGWTVTGQNDRIWWAIPRLASGSIEFTVSNMTLSNLIAADGEIFAMYEAGHEIEEPVDYSPELRNNHYKAFIRVYGTNEPGRAGSMKLIWIMCPSGAPGYSTDAALCGCGSFLEEPFEDPGPWDGSPQRIRLEWGDGISRVLRNGTEVVSVDWSESGIAFGPHELHFMLGNSRNGAVGDGASMPIGAVFSDIVVDGTEGPIATCGGTLDAGMPPPTDAGAADVDSGTLGGDGGAPSDAGGALDGAPRGTDGGARAATGDLDSGCGCRIALPAAPHRGPALLALAALCVVARMRRRSEQR